MRQLESNQGGGDHSNRHAWVLLPPQVRANMVISWAARGVLACLVVAILIAAFRVFYFSDLNALAASIQDDSFYYLVPAFNVAHGRGFTFGGVPSYGFEPGYEVVLGLAAFAFQSLHEFFRFSLLLSAIFFAASGVAIYLATISLARSIDERAEVIAWRSIAALGASVVYLSNGWNYFNSTTGKENSLSALLLALSLVSSLAKRDRGRSGPAIVTGLIAGFLALTRPVPATLLYIGVLTFVHRRELKKFVMAASTVIAVWIVFAYVYFGSVVPYSALVKAQEPSHPVGLKFMMDVCQYVLTSLQFGVWGPSPVEIPQPNWRDALRPGIGAIFLYSWFAISVLLFARAMWARRGLLNRRHILLPGYFMAMLLGAALMGAAVLLKRPYEEYYASWYFYDSPVVVSALMGVGLYLAVPHVARMRRGIPIFLGLAMAAFAFGVSAHYIALRPYSANDFVSGIGKRWQNTMIAAGLWYRNHVVDWRRKTVAAGSAGALDFTLDDRVINLDGLSNDRAARELLGKGVVTDYLKVARPDYIIDVHDLIFSVAPPNSGVRLVPVKKFPFLFGGYWVAQTQFTP